MNMVRIERPLQIMALLLLVNTTLPGLIWAQDEPPHESAQEVQAEIERAFDAQSTSDRRRQALHHLGEIVRSPQAEVRGLTEANLRRLAHHFPALMLVALAPWQNGPTSLQTQAGALLVALVEAPNRASDQRGGFLEMVGVQASDRTHWEVWQKVVGILAQPFQFVGGDRTAAEEANRVRKAANVAMLNGNPALLGSLIVAQGDAVSVGFLRYLRGAMERRTTFQAAERLLHSLLYFATGHPAEPHGPHSPLMSIATRGESMEARFEAIATVAYLHNPERGDVDAAARGDVMQADLPTRVNWFWQRLFDVPSPYCPFVMLAFDESLTPEMRGRAVDFVVDELRHHIEELLQNASQAVGSLERAVAVLRIAGDMLQLQTPARMPVDEVGHSVLLEVLQDAKAPATLRRAVFELLVDTATVNTELKSQLAEGGLQLAEWRQIDRARGYVDRLMGDAVFQTALTGLLNSLNASKEAPQQHALLASVRMILVNPLFSPAARQGAANVAVGCCLPLADGSSIAERAAAHVNPTTSALGFLILLHTALGRPSTAREPARETLRRLQAQGRLDQLADDLGEDDLIIRGLRASLAQQFRYVSPRRVLFRNAVLAARLLAVTRDDLLEAAGVAFDHDKLQYLRTRLSGDLVGLLNSDALAARPRALLKDMLGFWYPDFFTPEGKPGGPLVDQLARLFNLYQGESKLGDPDFAHQLGQRFPQLRSLGLVEYFDAPGLSWPQLRLTPRARMILPRPPKPPGR